MEFTSKRQDRQDAQQEPFRFPFKLDGVEFTAQERVDADSVLEWSELMGAVLDAGDAEMESTAGAAISAKYLRMVLPDEEYARFRAHLRKNKTPSETLTEIVKAIMKAFEERVEASAERPTGPSSPSSAGQRAKDERRLQIMSLVAEGDVAFAEAPPADTPFPEPVRFPA